MTRTTLFAGAVLALGLASGQARAALFNFEAQTAGTATPLTITAGNVSATFTTTLPGGFAISPVPYPLDLQSGQDLVADPYNFGPADLTITFNHAVTNLNLAIALLDLGGTGDTFGYAVNGSTSVTTVSAPLDRGGLLPEALLRVSGPVTSITLTAAEDFLIDNVAVPEPATLAVLGLGLAGVAAARRRRA